MRSKKVQSGKVAPGIRVLLAANREKDMQNPFIRGKVEAAEKIFKESGLPKLRRAR